ncbi:MAG: immunoglobulin domain-containing protein, partial [Limisphaerales bacterium]
YNPNSPAPLGEYTNLNYTAGFNGTSSAAPLAAGVIALMLEANPNLGWRDVQEILIRSAGLTDTNNGGWMTNAAGFHFNNEYGAGIVDADAATQLAEGWTNLSLRTNISTSAIGLSGLVSDSQPFSHTFTLTNNEFRIEHIQLRTDISHPIRGDLQITVTSPSGMRSIMSRVHQDLNPDYVWQFNSVFHWGEIAEGDWTIDVVDLRPTANGIVNDLELEFFGSISNAVFQSLTNPPVVLNHPLSRTATKGSDVLFRVNSIGSGQLNYRWLFNGQELSGQNASTLIVSDVTRTNQGTYHARIDNQFGSVVSAGASLFVNAPPEITMQPGSQLVNFGGSVTMNVAAEGNSPLLYQWRFNGTPLANEVGASLTINDFQSVNAGNYDVVIQNPVSSIISDLALVSANMPVVFSNAQLSGGGGSTFMFGFSGPTGQTFRVDGSADLRLWTTNLSTIVLTNGSGSFSDGTAGTFSNRYYRVVPLP